MEKFPDLEERIPEDERGQFNLFAVQPAAQQPEDSWMNLDGKPWIDVAVHMVKEHIFKLYNIGKKFPVVLVFDPQSRERLEMKEEDAVEVMRRSNVSEEVVQAAIPCIRKALDRSPEMNQETTIMKNNRSDKNGAFPPSFLRHSRDKGRFHGKFNFLRPYDRADGAMEQKWVSFQGERVPVLSVRAKIRSADELIALLVRQVHERMPNDPIRIQSADRDLMMAMLWPSVTINRRPDEDWTLEKEGCEDAQSLHRMLAMDGKTGDWRRVPMVLYGIGDYHHRQKSNRLYHDEPKLLAFIHEAGQKEPILRVRIEEEENGEERVRVVAEPRSDLLLGQLWSNLIVMNIDPGSEFSWLPKVVYESLLSLAVSVCDQLRVWRKEGFWQGQNRRQNHQQMGRGNGGRGRERNVSGASGRNSKGGHHGGMGGRGQGGGRGRGGRGT
ncbi:hypothetical protein DUNSADRAFT_18085 [Dunaliella salina]|uniref:Uncharacterized protein n=1 Tax=Dunaliella salina TaxID=3046 RepID=A0ABQ7G0Q4_DUNSA|nr:hypothetical protein DUNSADRAFT_18085 [Dunaliella salina]|eukprot:KAF5828179.1 hypothetical protein DUNSADRAFT_18085 [Dunaliella salina]